MATPARKKIDPKGLLEYIAHQLVEKPQKLKVEEKEDPRRKKLIFEIQAAEEDRGILIGKQGDFISSLRTLFSSLLYHPKLPSPDEEKRWKHYRSIEIRILEK